MLHGRPSSPCRPSNKRTPAARPNYVALSKRDVLHVPRPGAWGRIGEAPPGSCTSVFSAARYLPQARGISAATTWHFIKLRAHMQPHSLHPSTQSTTPFDLANLGHVFMGSQRRPLRGQAQLLAFPYSVRPFPDPATARQSL